MFEFLESGLVGVEAVGLVVLVWEQFESVNLIRIFERDQVYREFALAQLAYDSEAGGLLGFGGVGYGI